MTRYIMILSLALCCNRVVAQQAHYHKVELYFGLAKKGRNVSERQWRTFVDSYVTPKFPTGLTIYDAHGQWRNGDGKVVKEKTKVLMLLCPDTPESGAAIKAIKIEYCDMYDQDSVMEVDSDVTQVTF